MEAQRVCINPISLSGNHSRSIRLRRYPIKDVGVDWITCTCRDGETRDEFQNFGYSLLHSQSHSGTSISPWSFEGFEGLKTDGVAVGVTDDMTIIRLSSSTAWAYWRRVFELSTNCSRIDFQVTFGNIPNVTCLIHQSHNEALAYSDNTKLRPSVELRDNNRRGPTLYLGVRTSARFGRLYDKYRESRSEHYSGCARAELQINGKAAVFAGRAVCSMPPSPNSVLSLVDGFFRRRGVLPWWPDVASHHLTVPRQRGTTSSRLRWLRLQVKPSLELLAAAGYGKAALEALGLTDIERDARWSNGPTLNELE